jgi:hypothetical protein
MIQNSFSYVYKNSQSISLESDTNKISNIKVEVCATNGKNNSTNLGGSGAIVTTEFLVSRIANYKNLYLKIGTNHGESSYICAGNSDDPSKLLVIAGAGGGAGINHDGGDGGGGISSRTITLGPEIYPTAVSASTTFNPDLGSNKAFDNNISTFWHSAAIYANSGTYNGSVTTTVNSVEYKGEYIGFRYHLPIYIHNFIIVGRQDNNFSITRVPKSFVLLGCNDFTGSGNNGTWTIVYSTTDAGTYDSANGKTFIVSNQTEPFMFYLLITRSIYNNTNADSVNISAIRIFSGNSTLNIPTTTPSTTGGFKLNNNSTTGNVITVPSSLAFSPDGYIVAGRGGKRSADANGNQGPGTDGTIIKGGNGAYFVGGGGGGGYGGGGGGGGDSNNGGIGGIGTSGGNGGGNGAGMGGIYLKGGNGGGNGGGNSNIDGGRGGDGFFGGGGGATYSTFYGKTGSGGGGSSFSIFPAQ